MKRPWRVAVKALVLSCLVGGLCYAGPNMAEQVGLDFWNYPRVRAALDAEIERKKQLKLREEQVHQTMAMRFVVTAQLRDGRITFDEAVAEFVELNNSDSRIRDAVMQYFPAATLEESTRLQVKYFLNSRSPLVSASDDKNHATDAHSSSPAMMHVY